MDYSQGQLKKAEKCPEKKMRVAEAFLIFCFLIVMIVAYVYFYNEILLFAVSFIV